MKKKRIDNYWNEIRDGVHQFLFSHSRSVVSFFSSCFCFARIMIFFTLPLKQFSLLSYISCFGLSFLSKQIRWFLDLMLTLSFRFLHRDCVCNYKKNSVPQFCVQLLHFTHMLSLRSLEDWFLLNYVDTSQ